MKLTYFGTAAAEGFPAIFCHCPYCKEARRLGGKNIRTRSQAMIDDALLLDLPPDTYAHFLQNGIEGDRLAYLLLTHAHPDHLCPSELIMRRYGFAHDMRAEVLEVICSATTKKALGALPPTVRVTVIEPYQPMTLGAYRITALPARHMQNGDAFIYIIEGTHKILYAHDTGFPYEEVFSYLGSIGIAFDMVSLDCTNVDIPIGDEGGHMGFSNIGRMLARLTEIGAVTDKTVKYVNHFSHNARPLQHLLEERAAEYGCLVAYDGCTVTL